MKKLFNLAVIALAAAAISSCALNTSEEIKLPAKGVFATIDNPIPFDEGETTRALATDMDFQWEATDRVDVYGSEAGEKMIYRLKSYDNDQNSCAFQIVKFGLLDDTYYAMVPSQWNQDDPTAIPVSMLGQNQSANNNTDHLTAYDYNTASAAVVSNNGAFAFSHRVAWVKSALTVPVACTAKSVTLTGGENAFVTEGTLNVVTNELTPTAYASSITLTLGGEDGIELAAGETLTAFITLFPTTAENITLTLTADVESTLTQYVSNIKSIAGMPAGRYANRNAAFSVDGNIAVATLDGVPYSSLEAAFAAAPADGSTYAEITMLQDVVIDGNAGITVLNGQFINFNLNGKNVSNNITSNATSQVFDNYGSLYIEGTGSIYSHFSDGCAPSYSSYITSVIRNHGTLTIDGPDIIADCDNESYKLYSDYCVINLSGAHFRMWSGHLYNHYSNALYIKADEPSQLNKVDISGGTIEGYGCMATSNAFSDWNCDIFINGGHFLTTEDEVVSGIRDLESASVALLFRRYLHGSNMKIEICGGVFDVPVWFVAGGATTTDSKMSIEGGTFNSSFYNEASAEPPFITGGTFISSNSGNVTPYICAGYTTKDNANGTFTVKRIPEYYEKVTSAPENWTGEYLLVFENAAEGTGLCWTGEDAGQCHADALIADNKISLKPDDAATITILSMTGGYAIKINGGVNDDKYIGWSSNTSNGMTISDTPLLNTVALTETGVAITGTGGRSLRYNTASGASNERFRYYTSTSQSAVQLYKYSHTKQIQTVSFPASSYTATIGEVFTSPVASGIMSIPSYSSDRPGVASVSSGGFVTIHSAGVATITAEAMESDMYYPALASYTLTVEAPAAAPLTTMDEIFAKAGESSGADKTVSVTFNDWVVSGVKGSNAYVTDGTKGFIIYKSSHGFSVGDVLSGTVENCQLCLYNGSAEFKNVSSASTGLTVTAGGTVTPQAASISSLTGVNTGAVVTLNEVTYDGENLTDASSNTIVPYSSLYSYTMVAGVDYNVTGVFQLYGLKKEIMPRSAADVVLFNTTMYNVTIAAGIAGGTVTASASSALAGTEITLTVTPETGNVLTSLTVKDALNNPVTLTGNKFVMPASNVTVLATFDVGSGETVASVSFEDKGFANGQEILSAVNIDANVTVTFAKNTGSNTPKYYTTGTAVRAYYGNSFTVSAPGKIITSIELTFGSGDFTNAITVDSGSLSSNIWSGSASSVVFTIGGTSGHRRVSGLRVTYN